MVLIPKLFVGSLANVARHTMSDNQFDFIKGHNMKDKIVTALDCEFS